MINTTINFSNLTKRLESINFAEDKINEIRKSLIIENLQWNYIENEFGDEYKEGVKTAAQTIFNLKKIIAKFPTSLSNGMVISGRGGIGKTYNLKAVLKKMGPEIDPDSKIADPIPGQVKWMIHEGSSITPKILYEKLTRVSGPNDIFVLDDCDSALTQSQLQGFLKLALVGDRERKLSHPSPGSISEGVPERMTYTGKIIWLTNKNIEGDTSLNALMSRFKNNSFNPDNFSTACYNIHALFDTNQYPYDSNKYYARRANWVARFLWKNRKYFVNDLISFRAGPKIIDMLDDSDDDINGLLQFIESQAFYVDPNDKSKHKWGSA